MATGRVGDEVAFQHHLLQRQLLLQCPVRSPHFSIKNLQPIYFCFGDYRTGEKQYRIFKVQSVDDAYNVADELGYSIVLDNCVKAMHIDDLEARTIVSILQTIEIKLKEVENVVSCYRVEYSEAQRMKRHFMRSDMTLYFPKMLPEPVPTDYNVGGKPFMKKYRDMPWIIEYWTQKYKEANLRKIPVRTLETDEMLMQNAAIREKKPSQ